MGQKVSTEATVKDVRRQTRQQHNAEEKIRIVLKACGAKRPLPNCVAGKGSRKACTTSGARNSWRQASRA
jgi:hypothetical protein